MAFLPFFEISNRSSTIFEKNPLTEVNNTIISFFILILPKVGKNNRTGTMGNLTITVGKCYIPPTFA